MEVKLYSKVTVNIVKTAKPLPGMTSQTAMYENITHEWTNFVAIPEAEQVEVLLGIFPAETNGGTVTVYGKKDVRLDAGTMTLTTRVNVFRGEIA